jgi:arginine repressor
MSESLLETVSSITQFNDIHEFLQDEDVDRALDLVVKILMKKGSVPSSEAPRIIVELQALSSKFAIMATYYATIGKDGTKESHKKNLMFTMRDALSKLADALKYVAKE